MFFSRGFIILFCSGAFLVSCTGSYTEGSSYEMSLTKQKQRVNFLQKKLQMAEKEKNKIEEEVERLAEEVSLAKLSLISKLVDGYEREILQNPKKWSHAQSGDLFLKERETLYELIQTSSYSFEAQLVLDKILQIITNLSDE